MNESDRKTDTEVIVDDHDSLPERSEVSGYNTGTKCVYDDQVLSEIWEELKQHEAIQLKGVCTESRKYVHAVAKWICAKLEERQLIVCESTSNDNSSVLPQLPVALLTTKGHTCLLYSPTLPLNHENKFLRLRTSVGQKNTWDTMNTDTF